MEDDLESSATADDHATNDQAESDAAEPIVGSTNANDSEEVVASATDESAAQVETALADDSGEHDTEPSELPLCPYCGTSVESDPVDCPACSTTYHFDCASEAGGCIQPGCSSSVLAPTEPPPPPPTSSPTGDAAPSSSAPEPKKSKSLKGRTSTRFLVPIAAVLIGLVLGGLAVKTNVASALVGKSYSKSDVSKAKDDGYESGYSSGRDAGYTSGRSAGYSSGFSEGKTAGCKSVFTSLSTTRVVDYYDWLFDLRSPTYLASYQC
jgi:hypothetical protein